MRWNRFHLTAGHSFLILAPAHLWFAVADRDHRDAFIHGTHQRAEIATDTILLAHLGNRFARNTTGAKAVTIGIYQINALMRPIFAGNVAEVAPDAFVVVDARHALIVKVQGFPFLDGGNRFAHQIHHAL